MAANSKREQIIVKVEAELNAVASISHVVRKRPTYESLQSFPITQLPVVAIVSGIPKPVPHNVGRRPPKDVFQSELRLSLYCYFQANANPDTTLSTLLDDLWAALYADTTKGGLVIDTTLDPEPTHDFWDPFYAFKLDVITQYYHNKGGI